MSSITPTMEENHHLDWTSKQGRILTASGKALDYYTADRGFPFQETELPHYYLQQNETHSMFLAWARSSAETCTSQSPSPICGAWKRPLFCGAWEHSTEDEELVFNIQTNTLFVDLRIPKSRRLVLTNNNNESNNDSNTNDCTSLASMTHDQLRLYARQHVFGGYSMITTEQNRMLCTRHHCIDWNYIEGHPRPRPNKWWIEVHPTNSNIWKEYSFATDDFGQHYYMERWERLEGDDFFTTSPSTQQRFAMRRQEGPDGILVVVGDHFNYLFNRCLLGTEILDDSKSSLTLVNVVDDALARGDRATAESYLSMDAGHGRVSDGWIIDASIQPWREGDCLFEDGDLSVVGDSIATCHILWKGSRWTIYECSFTTLDDLRRILLQRP